MDISVVFVVVGGDGVGVGVISGLVIEIFLTWVIDRFVGSAIGWVCGLWDRW
jgi:hypothetical protein